MKWKHKALVQRLVARLPEHMSLPAYYFLQRRFGGLGRVDHLYTLNQGRRIFSTTLHATRLKDNAVYKVASGAVVPGSASQTCPGLLARPPILACHPVTTNPSRVGHVVYVPGSSVVTHGESTGKFRHHRCSQRRCEPEQPLFPINANRSRGRGAKPRVRPRV